MLLKKEFFKSSRMRYAVLLLLGLTGILLPAIAELGRAAGPAALVGIYAFLVLTNEFRTVKQIAVTGAAFCIGYISHFLGITGSIPADIGIFLPVGLVLYGAFLLYAFILKRWNRFAATLVFPALWLVIFYAATLLRFPVCVRIDVLFADLEVLIQTESLIGSQGLSFLLLWTIALFYFSVRNRRMGVLAIGSVLTLAMFVPGMIYLYPAAEPEATVHIAYTTGPYGGNYINYQAPDIETCLQSMENSVHEAARQGASILVFNEETFEIDDTDETVFLEKCSSAAREEGIHVLVGLDERDTDNSENGKSLNKLVWIDRNGNILGSYLKTFTIPVIESDYEAGNGEIPSHTITAEGQELKISFLICYDSNFSGYVGKIDSDTDILFLPSWDWAKVAHLHRNICRLLAVENRLNVLKPTYDGISIAVSEDGRIISSSDTAADGYETVHIVDFPIRTEAAAPPAEGGNSFTASIIATEILSMIICLVLLLGNCFENRERSRRNKCFNLLLCTNIAALGSDMLSWVLDGAARLDTVLFVTSELAMVLTYVIMAEFLFFVDTYIGERQDDYHPSPLLLISFYGAAVLITLAASFSGILFHFENGRFCEGEAYSLYVIMNIATILFSSLKIIRNRKVMGRRGCIAAYLYIMIPTVCAAINVFIEDWSFAYQAITVSLLIIYVMLQSDRVDRLRIEKQISAYHAGHDELTGLYNRRAYDERLELLSRSTDNLGVIFSDLNNLKYTNDKYGHAAGDQLLTEYARLLCGHFRKDEIYRISGDEFVVLLHGLPEEAFGSRIKEFDRELCAEDKKRASVGGAYGESRDVIKLIQIAETRMYEDKKAYHLAHPVPR